MLNKNICAKCRHRMKKSIACVLLILVMLAACGAKPSTEVTSATIETNIKTGNIWQTIEGYRPARIDFTVSDFGDTPSVEDAADVKQVTVWFLDYAHCYQNGEELKRSYYYYNKDSFKKGKQCVITAFYQIPDDGIYNGLKFSFDLEGFETSYDGAFTNNVKQK